jgi:kynureninase
VTGDEHAARALDRDDPLSSLRREFAVPPWPGGLLPELAYLAGSSLGLMPQAARDAVIADLDDWAALGVEGHSGARHPWLTYHEAVRDTSARLVGARPGETVCMNSLTVNLHLMMVSFYRPTRDRYRILIDDAAFPSDSYAVASQLRHHGLHPDAATVRLRPREGERTLRAEDVIERIEREGPTLALVLLGGVSYLTGELLPIAEITAATHEAGAVSGWDLAHAAGNVPLALHDWDVDWAAWCSYKYLNSGPGAVAGCFVHERHARDPSIPRFAGWWGNELAVRFRMSPVFEARPDVEGWQLSNPPILSFAPVRVSLEIFDRAGIDSLRQRSLRLTGFLEALLHEAAARIPLTVITPRDAGARGCQLSIEVPGDAREVARRLRDEHGVVCDERPPNIVRLTPVPLYNTFHDVWRAAAGLVEVLDASPAPSR